MSEFLGVALITILAVISPGPDFLMVSRNSLLSSRRAGVFSALGISAGIWVHIIYSICGIGLLISKSIILFNVLKVLGGAYLLYLGAKMLRAKAQPDIKVELSGRALSDWQAFRTGFLTNALNPKATVFIVSLFMQAIHPATPLSVQLGLGVFISVTHMVWFTAVSLFFSTENIRKQLFRIRHWIDRVFGALLAGFGIALAASTLSSGE